jgi:hypothetical protein
MSAAQEEGMPTTADWAALTESPAKSGLFAQDLYFRECWDSAVDTFGTKVTEALAPLGLVSFKSDGIAGRRGERTLDYLARHGFTIVAFSPFRHNRHSMRELWRYNWHVYTTDRLALMTLMHTAAETMLVIVRDDRYDGVVPATVRLADLKGSADPAHRGPDHLRSVLEPPNQTINFVHVADEPADLVRETGILLDRSELRRLLSRTAIGEDLGKEAREELARLEGACPANRFDLAESLERLAASTPTDAGYESRLRRAIADGGRMSWDELASLTERIGPGFGVYDFVRIATEVLPSLRSSSTELLPASSAEAWRAHRGRTV